MVNYELVEACDQLLKLFIRKGASPEEEISTQRHSLNYCSFTFTSVRNGVTVISGESGIGNPCLN